MVFTAITDQMGPVIETLKRLQSIVASEGQDGLSSLDMVEIMDCIQVVVYIKHNLLLIS